MENLSSARSEPAKKMAMENQINDRMVTKSLKRSATKIEYSGRLRNGISVRGG
jgi:hypothetical protein